MVRRHVRRAARPPSARCGRRHGVADAVGRRGVGRRGVGRRPRVGRARVGRQRGQPTDGLPRAEGDGGRGGDKRAAAERRNARYRATKDLRREVAKVEGALGRVEAEIAALQHQLADPDVYADGARVKELVAQHGAAKDRAQELFERWERSQLALERAEASIDA
jgi:ATP-binding cassette, subfamily F, member 3